MDAHNKISTFNSIKDWAEADRPREKLAAKGRKALSDAELLAVMLEVLVLLI